jgi:hypothetical protein
MEDLEFGCGQEVGKVRPEPMRRSKVGFHSSQINKRPRFAAFGLPEAIPGESDLRKEIV